MIDRACMSLNHRCNLKCAYCHFAGKNYLAQDCKLEILPSEATKVIDNIVAYCKCNGMRRFKLGIVGSGEPLLSYETLKAVVEQAARSDGLFSLYTITNGVSLTDEQIAFFFDNREIIEVNFSLDGYEEIHNALRQSYQQTMDSICRYEIMFKEKPRINATVTRKSAEGKRRLVEFFVENRFSKINFSAVVDVTDPALTINREEYEEFLNYCEDTGIVMRQKRSDIERTYDCTMFGRLCGVGKTNIFITKMGIYPCGRFFGLSKYKLAGYDAQIADVERNLSTLKPMDRSCCYYETVVRAQ